MHDIEKEFENFKIMIEKEFEKLKKKVIKAIEAKPEGRAYIRIDDRYEEIEKLISMMLTDWMTFSEIADALESESISDRQLRKLLHQMVGENVLKTKLLKSTGEEGGRPPLAFISVVNWKRENRFL